ncbi:helix-turn-helix domain-containing protein [Neobacillus sp. NPDC093182]|uniref:helix-turn-helix domain-containing protein n=1 Tax=Neobacillus sp. NPDC093182 TaxID=3364297 RepID=UPI0038182523
MSTGKKRKYHEAATGKDKIIYEEVVRLLTAGISVMNIHHQTGLSSNTIYSIKRENDNLL